MTEIRIPKGVSATIQDGGSCWVVRLSVDQNIQKEPAQPCAESVNEQPAEQPAPELAADRKRLSNAERQKRYRIRKRNAERNAVTQNVTASVTKRNGKRNAVTQNVTESVTRNASERNAVTPAVTGRDCLIECLTDGINNNIINKSNQSIRQTSVAKSVTRRNAERNAVTPDETREDPQIYLDLDYQLPPTIDEPKAREAWQTWLRYRRDMGGCRRISMKALHAIFDMLEFYHKTGGERAVVQILEYSVERERLNQLVAPRDVYRTPPPEPEPKPKEPEISPEESEEVSRSMKEFLEKLKRHRIPVTT